MQYKIKPSFRVAAILGLLAVWVGLAILEERVYTQIAETPMGPLITLALNAENLARHPKHTAGRDITAIASAHIKVGSSFEEVAKLLTASGFSFYDSSHQGWSETERVASYAGTPHPGFWWLPLGRFAWLSGGSAKIVLFITVSDGVVSRVAAVRYTYYL